MLIYNIINYGYKDIINKNIPVEIFSMQNIILDYTYIGITVKY